MGNLKRLFVPLALKISLVVSTILGFSLAAIILSAAFFIRADIRRTAVVDNDGINFRVSAATEAVLRRIRSDAVLLLGPVARSGGNSRTGALFPFYFRKNPLTAALVLVSPEGRAQTFINAAFIRSSEISSALIAEYLNLRGNDLLRLSGEALVVNASPDFYGVPLLAAAFPLTVEESLRAHTAIVFFSPEDLADYFGSGASRSILLNDRAGALIDPGAEGTERLNLAANPIVAEFFRRGKSAGTGGEVLLSQYNEEDGPVFAALRDIGFGCLVLTTLPGDIVYEGIASTTRRNLYFAIFVWFFSLLLSYLFAVRLTRQLGVLGEAARNIENGFYRRPIPEKTRDEAGFLSVQMNRMRSVLHNFERFTNKEIARQTRRGLLLPGGTEKHGVFLFSDIRSFTAFSEGMDPAELVEFLNGYMDRMVACVMAGGGVVDKFVGDAIIAHWGAVENTAPEETPEKTPEKTPEETAAAHVRAAFRSALLMRAALASLNQDRKAAGLAPVRAGCGINAGAVVAGQIGTSQRLEYTVIGDAVSLADRAESCNKIYGTEIIVTRTALNICSGPNISGANISGANNSVGAFIAEPLPPIAEKGERVELYALINTAAGGEEEQSLMAALEQIPGIDPALARRYVGTGGPQNLAELRKLLGLHGPLLNKVQSDEREKKFQIRRT